MNGRQTAYKPTMDDLRAMWSARYCTSFVERYEYEVGFEEFLEDLRQGRTPL